MVTVGASGREVSLTAGDYRARIVTVGAGLAGLTYRGHELIIPHSVDECPPAYLGKVLMPWPNRIAEGTYSWEGTSYDLPANEHAFGTSLHGFVAFQEWEIAEADTSSVLLRTLIPARYSYPWTLVASARYSLDPERGLAVELSATNIGEGTAPYGVGFHPYLAVDGVRVDDLELENPASIIYEADASMIPVAPTTSLPSALTSAPTLSSALPYWTTRSVVCRRTPGLSRCVTPPPAWAYRCPRMLPGCRSTRRTTSTAWALPSSR